MGDTHTPLDHTETHAHHNNIITGVGGNAQPVTRLGRSCLISERQVPWYLREHNKRAATIVLLEQESVIAVSLGYALAVCPSLAEEDVCPN